MFWILKIHFINNFNKQRSKQIVLMANSKCQNENIQTTILFQFMPLKEDTAKVEFSETKKNNILAPGRAPPYQL